MDNYNFNSVSWDTSSDNANVSNGDLNNNHESFSNMKGLETSLHESYSEHPDELLHNGFENEVSFNNSPTQKPAAFQVTSETQNHSRNVGQSSDTKEIEGYKMIVRILEPKKSGEGTSDVHVSYLIQTETELPNFSAPEVSVRRRFHDFAWLHDDLLQNFPASIVPPLPENITLLIFKIITEYLTGDRFSDEFIEKRRASLERFLSRIVRHPTLQKTSYVQKFLDSNDWNTDSMSKAKGEGILENLSDSLINSFSKIKNPDQRFIDIKDQIDKFEDNLNSADKLHLKINKRQADLEAEYKEFGQSLSSLGQLESGMTSTLEKFTNACNDYSQFWSDSTKEEDLKYLSIVREYLAYCQVAKAALKLRDQKQVDFEELSEYLQAQLNEREKIRTTGRGGGLSSFLKDTYDGIKGIDHEVTKQDRLSKCEEKINELEDAVHVSGEVSNAFSNELVKEYKYFQINKTADFKNSLNDLADTKINFFKKASIKAFCPIYD
ncbi:putative lipid binding protein [Conidiobolus coronatus NRRL 28638]|uniref:Sorting nexin-4 n=1 Tax=Conidiobolus coronatus (strain ATCC 28846 / CBS 209.66 / NRRL 28638) TaxID=796925 RepID=A0A137P638_CONC2|nr:putative lipid binding protein [Conidiobolus coronatus NRRL 28638]|eukprot:KXN70470.1 putative lipid binding protein [Conidiobolus coronatus NRRL 28638]